MLVFSWQLYGCVLHIQGGSLVFHVWRSQVRYPPKMDCDFSFILWCPWANGADTSPVPQYGSLCLWKRTAFASIRDLLEMPSAHNVPGNCQTWAQSVPVECCFPRIMPWCATKGVTHYEAQWSLQLDCSLASRDLFRCVHWTNNAKP